MADKLVVVAGNIGVGKTSITERIGQKFGWNTSYEVVSTNPYLPNYYQDMKKWGFHLQIFFLGTRAEQYQQIVEKPGSAILDRSIYEDYYIFTQALRRLNNFSETDYLTYQTIYNVVVKSLPKPDLLVYLKAPVDVLIERIKMRGRDMESSIDPNYLKLLDQLYDEWLVDFDYCPVLTIQSDKLDFVQDPNNLDTIIDRINQKLKGHDNLVFD